MSNSIVFKLKEASAALKEAAKNVDKEKASKQASDPIRHEVLANHYYQVRLHDYLNAVGGTNE